MIIVFVSITWKLKAICANIKCLIEGNEMKVKRMFNGCSSKETIVQWRINNCTTT